MLAYNTLENMHKPMDSRPPMNKTDASRPEKSRPDRAEPLMLFGPPPLFDGEDPKIYDHLLAQVSTTVMPEDIFKISGCATSLTSRSRCSGYAGSRRA